MLKTTMTIAVGGMLMLLANPANAQQIEVDRAAMVPLVEEVAPIRVTAKMPAKVINSRISHLISNDELNEQRGGETLVVTNQTLTAITQGNVLNGDFLAGDVNLSDSALSSFNGVGNILINTGAQVSLQTGMNLTINIGE